MYYLTYHKFRKNGDLQPMGAPIVETISSETINAVNMLFLSKRNNNDLAQFTALCFDGISEAGEKMPTTFDMAQETKAYHLWVRLTALGDLVDPFAFKSDSEAVKDCITTMAAIMTAKVEKILLSLIPYMQENDPDISVKATELYQELYNIYENGYQEEEL